MLMKKVAANLRALRKAKNLSQMKLADRAGLSYQYVGNFERGESDITLSSIEKLAKALDVTPGELVASDEILAMREVHDLISGVPQQTRVLILTALRHVILAATEATKAASSRRRQ